MTGDQSPYNHNKITFGESIGLFLVLVTSAFLFGSLLAGLLGPASGIQKQDWLGTAFFVFSPFQLYEWTFNGNLMVT